VLRRRAVRQGVHPQMIRKPACRDRARILNRDRNVNTLPQNENKIVYWHRELPPVDAELMAEHTIEATSNRVAATIGHRGELWDRCYHELMTRTQERLAQEVARLGGHYAHVLDESIDTRRDDASGEAWLHGCFSYMLYRRP
jgi:hypothetical protein